MAEIPTNLAAEMVDRRVVKIQNRRTQEMNPKLVETQGFQHLG